MVDINDLKVGDEVIQINYSHSGEAGIVTAIEVEAEDVYVLWSNGLQFCSHPDNLVKTGKHYSEIRDLLVGLKVKSIASIINTELADMVNKQWFTALDPKTAWDKQQVKDSVEGIVTRAVDNYLRYHD